MKFGVVVFPGTWSDKDCLRILGPVLGQETVTIWHQDTDLQGCDAVILPGGFSYGDYLRAGAIARFAPVMGAIKSFTERGGLALGICNGFQILLEAGLLPGAMLRNNPIAISASSTPSRPPASASTTLSDNSARAIRPRLAPSAARTASS